MNWEQETWAFELLAALASATTSAHTEATLGQRLADTLGAFFPQVRVEVGRGKEVRRCTPASAARPLAVGQGNGRGGGDGGAMRIVVSLREEGREAGECRIELAPFPSLSPAAPRGGPGEAPLPGAFVHAIERVVQAAFAQVWALRRVAMLSKRAHGERGRLQEELAAVLPGEVVAVAPATKRLFFEVIPLVAAQDVTVLLRGETGTGKEVVARRIHALSPRSRRPFVKINCGALPEALAESALFGHEQGSFTGALRRHAGVFERAHGGTLLLDEVGELSGAMQARLLRVLQEGEFERVGGDAPVRVDVRVLAATHRPLEAMVAEGRFRQDLYYRLHVVPIEIPPLRERVEDIEGLVNAALRRLAARMGKPEPRVSRDDLSRLRAWRWPGNVRELENVLERAIVLSPRGRIELPASLGESFGEAPSTGTPPPAERLEDTLRRSIGEALDACGGRLYGPDGAAARLGLRPTTLQSKMKKLGLGRGRPGTAPTGASGTERNGRRASRG